MRKVLVIQGSEMHVQGYVQTVPEGFVVVLDTRSSHNPRLVIVPETHLIDLTPEIEAALEGLPEDVLAEAYQEFLSGGG